MNIKITNHRSKFYQVFINGIILRHWVEVDDEQDYVIVDLLEFQTTGRSFTLMDLANTTLQPDDVIMSFRVKMHGNIHIKQIAGRQAPTDETIP